MGPIKLCRDSVVSAARTKDEISGGDLLLVTLTEDGRARLAALTRQSVGLPLIIRIDGQTVSEPIVMEPIDSGQFQFNVMNVSMMKRWQARLEGNC